MGREYRGSLLNAYRDVKAVVFRECAGRLDSLMTGTGQLSLETPQHEYHWQTLACLRAAGTSAQSSRAPG
jgi:hypothetical protein